MSDVRLIAYYLPQFYPTPENDEWWGKGFTEWTNVSKSKPLFKGHYQPRVPADLGHYDLRIPEVREEQAKMAAQAGIEGFCYWHYWFGNGKRILDRVFREVLETGKPDFPFCLGWANESWVGWAHGVKNRMLVEQTYPGDDDIKAHFNAMLPAFLDKRYITVEGHPLFLIYQPDRLPNPQHFFNIWNRLAVKNGLPGMHFVAHCTNPQNISTYLAAGFDAVNMIRLGMITKYGRTLLTKAMHKFLKMGKNMYAYKDAIQYFVGTEDKQDNVYPGIFPNWDHSPRSGDKAFILHDSTPELFRKHVKDVLALVSHKPAEKQIVFVKSWNEWGEGNYLEPDLLYGMKYLEVLKSELGK